MLYKYAIGKLIPNSQDLDPLGRDEREYWNVSIARHGWACAYFNSMCM